MTHRLTLEPAYILHRRPYSNTSYIIDFFTRNHGRLSAIARSARGPKSRYQGKLELFVPMLISYSGRFDLKNLGEVEFYQAPINLEGDALICGFYLNELLHKLLQRDDPHARLFDAYEECLRQIIQPGQREASLRIFEKKLLQECGYGLEWSKEAKTAEPICAEKYYQYCVDQGFAEANSSTEHFSLISGRTLLGFANDCLDDARQLQEAKRLMRVLLAGLLDDKTIFSRALF